MLEPDTEFDKRVQAKVENRRKFELGITNSADSASQVEGYRDNISVDACDHDYLSSDSETVGAENVVITQFCESSNM